MLKFAPQSRILLSPYTGLGLIQVNNKTPEERFWSCVEIVVYSLFLFALAGGLAVGSAQVWKVLLKEDTVRWEVFIAAGIVGLLPYLVIAAKVWEVNLSVFGQAAATKKEAGESLDLPGRLILAGELADPPGPVLGPEVPVEPRGQGVNEP